MLPKDDGRVVAALSCLALGSSSHSVFRYKHGGRTHELPNTGLHHCVLASGFPSKYCINCLCISELESDSCFTGLLGIERFVKGNSFLASAMFSIMSHLISLDLGNSFVV